MASSEETPLPSTFPPRVTDEENTGPPASSWAEYGAREAHSKGATSRISPDTVMQFIGDLFSGHCGPTQITVLFGGSFTLDAAMDDDGDQPQPARNCLCHEKMKNGI